MRQLHKCMRFRACAKAVGRFHTQCARALLLAAHCPSQMPMTLRRLFRVLIVADACTGRVEAGVEVEGGGGGGWGDLVFGFGFGFGSRFGFGRLILIRYRHL